MSKTILMDVNSWTPVVDSLVCDTDLETAAIFGAIWRYCQMEHGECYASRQKIADRVGLSYKTVQRRIAILVDKGYLQDITPHMRYSPHTYRDTGKVAVRDMIKAIIDEGILDQKHPHTAYKSRDMQDTLERVAEDLEYKGELTPKRLKVLEDKLNPPPILKKRTNWNEEKEKYQASRSESPPG